MPVYDSVCLDLLHLPFGVTSWEWFLVGLFSLYTSVRFLKLNNKSSLGRQLELVY
jgi:hypothetical protein